MPLIEAFWHSNNRLVKELSCLKGPISREKQPSAFQKQWSIQSFFSNPPSAFMHVHKHTIFASEIKCTESTGCSFIVRRKAEHLSLCGCQKPNTATSVFQSCLLIFCAILPIFRAWETASGDVILFKTLSL